MQNEELCRQLEDKTILIENVGSIAEAAERIRQAEAVCQALQEKIIREVSQT